MPVRPPAVAGSFYEAPAASASSEASSATWPRPAPAPAPAFGAIVPHAGYVYSGPVAGAVYARLEVPPTCVILCPNHTGRGAAGRARSVRRLAYTARRRSRRPRAWRGDSWSSPRPSRRTPRPIAASTRSRCSSRSSRSGGRTSRSSRSASASASLDLCREIGEAARRRLRGNGRAAASARLLRHEPLREPRASDGRKDDMALARVEALDAEGLFRTVSAESISMCGVLPATALLFAARAAGAGPARVVARRDSGDETGDTSSVVGYAGVIVEAKR